MNAERVLKNILWRPEKAFMPELLGQTFPQSVTAFYVLALLTSANTTVDRLPKLHVLARYPQIGQAPHIAAFLFFVLMFLFLCANMWLIGFLAQWTDREVNLKTLIAGALWIYVVTLPLGWILHSVFLGWSRWVIFPYRLWLMTICIRSITGLSTWKSFWIYILSGALIFSFCVIAAIVIGGFLGGPIVGPIVGLMLRKILRLQ